MITTEQTLEACDEIVRARRTATHPFVTTLRTLQPERAALGRWAEQKQYQVYLQNTVFSGIHANAMEYEDVRQAMMEQLVAEETPIDCGTAAHYILMQRFASACGVEVQSFDRDRCSAAVFEFVSTVRRFACHDHFVLGILAVYAVESQSGEGVQKVLDWLREAHGFSAQELEWFTVHSEAEDEHAADGRALILKYAHLVPEFDRRARETVEAMCAAWASLHDSYHSLLQPEPCRASG